MSRRRRARAELTTFAVAGSARDLDLLSDLAWAGLLSTDQIERIYFPSRRRAQKRLRALLDLGLVRAQLQGEALHLPNVYTLAPKGRDLLVEHERFSPEEPPRLTRVPRLQKLRHALAIREVFVALRGAETEGVIELVDMLFEEQLVGAEPFAAHGIVPDAVVEVCVGGGPVRLGVEVDLGTETTRTLADKFARWRALQRAHGPVSRLLVLAPTDRRLSTLSRLAHAEGLERLAETLRLDGVDAWVRRTLGAHRLDAVGGRAERPVLRPQGRGITGVLWRRDAGV